MNWGACGFCGDINRWACSMAPDTVGCACVRVLYVFVSSFWRVEIANTMAWLMAPACHCMEVCLRRYASQAGAESRCFVCCTAVSVSGAKYGVSMQESR
eukprot:XP_001697480.1 predicted protein [Chlamydomonas reinhardtii]